MLAGGIAVYFDLHQNLYDGDQTKISFLILLIFFLTSIWIGWCTQKAEYQIQNIDIGWFISEACLALGMIGTVTGFLLMLSGAFADIDLANTATIQIALSK
ncbi:MAG TPA: hypothetical protein DCS22_01620, partial [Flavobacteriaceae bacterium]|nr:hypothetical protein [Flavobacteriaceae bacterium]